MENQGEKYQYSQPLSLTFTSPGAFSKRVDIPFGHECEIAVELCSLNTNDSSLLITVDNDPSVLPVNGPINGYLFSGSITKSCDVFFQPVTQYVWLLGNVGASNAVINVVLRFRRANHILVPMDMGKHDFTSGE